ncbi:hypothetical protein YC2023_085931 [Brassica napus]
MSKTVWSLRSDRVRYGSVAGRSLRGDLVCIIFRCSMNVFLDYGCLISMNQPRSVQDFTAKPFNYKTRIRSALLRMDQRKIGSTNYSPFS